MSNPLVHGGINTLVYVIVSLALSVPLSWGDWGLIVVFGIIFDLDHVPYFILHTRPFTFQNMKDSINADYSGQVPHFYACHTIEFQILLVCIYFGTGCVTWALWIVSGWFVHLVTDVVVYLRHYHGFFPWVKFWTIGYYFLKGKREQSI